MVDASECEEFVLELEGIKLVVRRGSGGNEINTGNVTPSNKIASPSHTATQTASVTSASDTTPGASSAKDGTAHGGDMEMRSPMVGTFYRRPAPEQAPFVETGDRVEPGTPLCLIEVMKLYTTIESTLSGTVFDILADDGELVEYDQLLFVFDSIVS